MEFHPKPGISLEIEKTVSPNDTAVVHGSGSMDVFATPAMIALMEHTAMLCVADSLPEGWTTVGTEVNIQHLKASLPGDKIICKATINQMDERRIVFSVEAKCNDEIIGLGNHTRFVVNRERFMAKLQKNGH